jgi:hypothetical protein
MEGRPRQHGWVWFSWYTADLNNPDVKLLVERIGEVMKAHGFSEAEVTSVARRYGSRLPGYWYWPPDD